MSTLYFPQLTIGSLAQYPITRHWSKAVTTNTLPDGSLVLRTGTARARVSWELCYRGLSVAEWTALEGLFSVVQGRFGTFTFVDPTDNLLASTEDFTASAWASDPLLHVNQGVHDPLGGTAAVTLSNTGQAPQRLMQSLSGPSWFQYCFSVYVRADTSPSPIYLIRSSAGSEAKQAVSASANWTRVSASGTEAHRDDSVRFGFEVPAGSSVMVFGPQVETQSCAGVYKSKADPSGVYSNSRFDHDELVQTTDVSGYSATTVQVIATY